MQLPVQPVRVEADAPGGVFVNAMRMREPRRACVSAAYLGATSGSERLSADCTELATR